jgi:hypothetical protein
VIRAKTILESLIQINERNVINTDDIEDWIDQLVDQTENHRVQEWVRKRLRMYLINDQSADILGSLPDNAPEWAIRAFNQGDLLYKVSFDDDERNEIIDLLHIMDRLAEFSPRDFDKMMKTPMSPDLLDRAAELEKQMGKRQGVKETGIHYPDGCRWVLLKTFDTIKWEGEEMANCLKTNTSTYFNKVVNGNTKLYSLRDTNDRPRVTAEVQSSGLYQIVGYEDGVIDKKYRPHCLDLIERLSLNYKETNFASLRNLGAVKWDGKVYLNPDDVSPVATWYALIDDVNDNYEIDMEDVEDLLKQGVHPDACRKDQQTLLFTVIKKRSISNKNAIPILLKHGANPLFSNHTPQYLETTPLGFTYDNIEEFRMLLDHVKPNMTYLKYQNGESLMTWYLFTAQSEHNVVWIEEMLRRGWDPDLDLNNERGGYTPLYVAVNHNMSDCVRVLLDYGADPNKPIKQSSRESPLEVAYQRKNYQIMHYLLQAGADPDELMKLISKKNDSRALGLISQAAGVRR